MKNWVLIAIGVALVISIIVFIVIYTMPTSKTKEKKGGFPVGGVAPGAPEGDVNESFLGTKAVPSVRNNNPGNIKMTANSAQNPWEGAIAAPNNTDGTFEQFTTLAYGTRAMLKLLTNYMNSGINTVKLIVDDWDRDNNWDYINFVAGRTGFGVNQILQPDEATLKNLSQAMVRFEAGKEFLTDARFERGYELL